ncbi:MAG: DUF2235 domain-containing protein [Rhodobacteraceae bacterium]|nr:DUF2235 domain-containing protein [Paracoccaceae bacterium]
MPRKLIVCLDGTGNEIEKKESNILRLYRCLKSSDTQIIYYLPGVGTMHARQLKRTILDTPRRLMGLISGSGLEQNVLDAYFFLCDNYQPGDQLYFFGYSRGAYTARVLAGFINDFGLVAPHQKHLIYPVFRAYRAISTKDEGTEKYEKLRLYDRGFNIVHPSIRFLGLWDTVSSLLRLRPKWGTFLEYGTHSSVERNPSVEVVRHVLAIDETRRFFRQQFWEPGQTWYGNRFRNNSKARPQDVKQVWFCGTHTDVAGSVSEAEAGLAKITLQWMKEELDVLKSSDGTAGPELEFRTRLFNKYVLGQVSQRSLDKGVVLSKPDPCAKMHSQMIFGWFLLEALPRLVRRSRWPELKGLRFPILIWYYLPLGQYRYIPPDAEIHHTVQERQKDSVKPYDPPNLSGF